MHMKRHFNATLISSAVALALLLVQPAGAVLAQQQLNVPQGSASLNWAGYVAQSQTTNTINDYTSVTGTWTVPTVTASAANAAASTGSGQADATWVGIGGVTSHDLIQAGTQAMVQNGAVVYNAWVETLPGYSQTISLQVQSGDSITTTLGQESAGVWRVTIVNNTTGQSYSATRAYNSSLSSAEWVEEMVSNTSAKFIPLDSFGSVAFTNVSAAVNGTSESLAQLGAQPLQMVNGQGQMLATASGIGSDNASFTVARTNVTPTTLVPRTITGGRWRVLNTATSTPGIAVPMTITILRRGHRFGGGFTFSIIRL